MMSRGLIGSDLMEPAHDAVAGGDGLRAVLGAADGRLNKEAASAKVQFRGVPKFVAPFESPCSATPPAKPSFLPRKGSRLRVCLLHGKSKRMSGGCSRVPLVGQLKRR
jgi:hypothetical protein